MVKPGHCRHRDLRRWPLRRPSNTRQLWPPRTGPSTRASSTTRGKQACDVRAFERNGPCHAEPCTRARTCNILHLGSREIFEQMRAGPVLPPLPRPRWCTTRHAAKPLTRLWRMEFGVLESSTRPDHAGVRSRLDIPAVPAQAKPHRRFLRCAELLTH